MNIVFLCNDLGLKTGWGVVSYHTVSLACHYFENVTVFTSHNSINDDFLSKKNLTIHPVLKSMTNSKLKFFIQMFDKYQISKKIDVDNVEIVHSLVEPLLPLIKIFKNSHKVLTIHGTYADYPFRSGFNRLLFRSSLEYIDAIASVSHYTASRFNNIFNSHIEVIPLGVDFNNFSSHCFNGVKQRAFVYVGKLKARKGFIFVLESFKRIIEKDNDVTLYVVGSDIEKDKSRYVTKCKAYIQENGMSQNIIFLGNVDHQTLVETYKKSICNLLPSINDKDYFEGFGLIHLEANACGIPTIGSMGCGNETAIVNDRTGYLCKQKDSESISKRMTQILAEFDSGKFSLREQQCVEYARENDWQNYFQKLYDKIYSI